MDSTLVLSTLVATLVFIMIYRQFKTYTYWSSRGINGPRPFPFVGTSVYLFFKNRVQLDEEWKNTYGRTYGVYEGSLPVLRTSDNELIRHVCVKDFTSFMDRNSNFVNSDQMKRWTFFSSTNDWSNQRALITPMFSGSKMKKMFPSLLASGEKFFAEIQSRQVEAAKGLAGSGRLFEMMDDASKAKALLRASCERASFSKDETMSLTLDTIAKCFFSLNLDTYRDKGGEFFRRAFAFARFDMAYFIGWSLVPSFVTKYFKLDPLPASKFEFFNRLSMNLVRDRRANKSGAGQRSHDMLQNLMEAKIPDEHENVYTAGDELEAHYNDRMSLTELDNIHRELERNSTGVRHFSDLEISSQSTFFFLAGFETTSSSLSFCLYELGHQQALQDEVYQELRSTLGSKVIEYSDLCGLEKLEAFISEALRLYNPVTENTRMVTADGGAVLPTSPPVRLDKGCVVSITGLVCHRDPDYWPEPMKFDMSRFYPENRHKIKSCTYLPFGVGPRSCAGMRFALLQIRLFLANLLLKYRVLPGPESQQYPPEFNRHTFFLQLANTDFRLVPRDLESSPIRESN